MTDITDDAFQEGHTARILGNAINPYRRAMSAVRDAGSRGILEKLALRWDEGFTRAVENARERSEPNSNAITKA